MYLAEADAQRPIKASEEPLAKACPSERWRHFPHSDLSDHGEACCRAARHWLRAMDFGQLNGGHLTSGPRWLRERFKWGPTRWPIHWCEAVKEKVIDCGVHSALAHEAFTARGLTAFRVQVVQRYSPDSVTQWRLKWQSENASDHWLIDDLIYHEANALLIGPGEVRIWDSSAGWWLNERQTAGYGSVAAVRVCADPATDVGGVLNWGGNALEINAWSRLP
jgi:hypothetical protein